MLGRFTQRTHHYGQFMERRLAQGRYDHLIKRRERALARGGKDAEWPLWAEILWAYGISLMLYLQMESQQAMARVNVYQQMYEQQQQQQQQQAQGCGGGGGGDDDAAAASAEPSSSQQQQQPSLFPSGAVRVAPVPATDPVSIGGASFARPVSVTAAGRSPTSLAAAMSTASHAQAATLMQSRRPFSPPPPVRTPQQQQQPPPQQQSSLFQPRPDSMLRGRGAGPLADDMMRIDPRALLEQDDQSSTQSADEASDPLFGAAMHARANDDDDEGSVSGTSDGGGGGGGGPAGTRLGQVRPAATLGTPFPRFKLPPAPQTGVGGGTHDAGVRTIHVVDSSGPGKK